MPRQYKRKRLAEEWSLDIRPTKIKKQINSSERWRAKKEIKEQLDDIDYPYGVNAKAIREEMEWQQAQECHYDETYGPAAMLSDTLFKLGFGIHDLHVCTCENLDNITDDDILRRAGYKI